MHGCRRPTTRAPRSAAGRAHHSRRRSVGDLRGPHLRQARRSSRPRRLSKGAAFGRHAGRVEARSAWARSGPPRGRGLRSGRPGDRTAGAGRPGQRSSRCTDTSGRVASCASTGGRCWESATGFGRDQLARRGGLVGSRNTSPPFALAAANRGRASVLNKLTPYRRRGRFRGHRGRLPRCRRGRYRPHAGSAQLA